MNIGKMKQIIGLLEELEHEDGVFSFDFFSKQFHVTHESLLNEPELQVEERDHSQYRYEVYVQHNGFKVFALAQAEDLKKFPQLKSYRRQLLLKQIAELEKEEEVTA